MRKVLKNVRLETGFQEADLGRVETITALFDITVEGGRIIGLQLAGYAENEGGAVLDLGGMLALPRLVDSHVHIDKTYLTMDFHSTQPTKNIEERLELEAKDLIKMRDSVETRSRAAIELLLAKGTTKLRHHVNVDPYCELKNLEGSLAALRSFKGIDFETVAFPQHGLLRKQCQPLLREAMKMGADLIGGIDPGGLDKDVEGSLKATFDLANEFGAGIDMHLHERGAVGLYTMERLCDLAQARDMRGMITISHGFALMDANPAQLEAMAGRFRDLGIGITSTYPPDRRIPVEQLKRLGVPVKFGCDGIYDSWGPFGTGDVLEKVKFYCMFNKLSDEISLAQALGLATEGVTPLDEQGRRLWPKLGDPADFVFLRASCSAEVVARLPQREAVMSGGTMVYQNVK